MSLECLVPTLLLLIMGLGYAGVVVWILGPRGEIGALVRGLGWEESPARGGDWSRTGPAPQVDPTGAMEVGGEG